MATLHRRWYRFRWRTWLLLILAATVALSAYSYWSDYRQQTRRLERELLSPESGERCTIVLKRELLGIERMAPEPAQVNGVRNYVVGPFVLMNDQWIVLAGEQPGEPQQWIPRENVLLLQLEHE